MRQVCLSLPILGRSQCTIFEGRGEFFSFSLGVSCCNAQLIVDIFARVLAADLPETVDFLFKSSLDAAQLVTPVKEHLPRRFQFSFVGQILV